MDLDNVKTELFAEEFLAVVLVGFGDTLAPLTSDYGDEPCPKALLPVANRPLIDYVLTWLEKAGIRDILIICPTRHRPSIHHHIHSKALEVDMQTLHVDLVSFDDSDEDNLGTCTVLRQFSNRIKQDFVIVPCDFIPPPQLPLSLLLNKFRIEALSESCIATTCWYSSGPTDQTSVEGWGPPASIFPVIWDAASGTLLHIDTPDDQDRNPDDIDLRLSMISQKPHVKLSSRLEDSHVYVCRRIVLDLLHEKPHYLSLREEFLPWVCRIQHQGAKLRQYLSKTSTSRLSDSQYTALRHSSSTTLLATSDSSDEPVSGPVKVSIFIPECDAPMRINTPRKLYEMSRRMLANAAYSLPTDPKDRSLIDPKAQISVDCIIGHSTQISERTTIKKSVIGHHCVIGKMVKIAGCVLFDHCVVADGAKLDGCILGKSTQVGSKAELTRCITQAGYEVGAGETVKGEKLEVSDWMETLPDNEDEI